MNLIGQRLACAAKVLTISLALNACVPMPLATTPDTAAPSSRTLLPDDDHYYRQRHAAGKPVLRIDTDHSLLVIEVHRGGSLARLGHEHIVASHEVHGRIAPDEGRADLIIPLDSLTVDEVPLRAEAGLDPVMPQQAIEATRRNMLDKVLDSARYPFAFIHVTRGAAQSDILHVRLTLHGVTRNMDVPARIVPQGDDVLTESRLSFLQSEFGMVPFSALGGALQVEDRIDLRFRIAAVPLPP